MLANCQGRNSLPGQDSGKGDSAGPRESPALNGIYIDATRKTIPTSIIECRVTILGEHTL